MRVTFVLPDANLGGGTRMIAQHADVLRERGHRVTLLSTPPIRPSFKQKVGRLVRGGGWPPSPRPGASHLDGLGLDHRVRATRGPLGLREVPDADVVVATWWETANWVAPLPPSKGSKAYFIQHFEALLGMPEEEVAATWRLPLRKIVCARWLAELARDRFDDPTAIYVRNGLNVGLFDAPSRPRNARSVVGMMYSPSPAKGLDAGFLAVERARQAIPDLHLVLFGANDPYPELPAPPDAEFIKRPSQESIRDIYARCDVWLCSSRFEGYHMPPLEAMGCHCPVVATKVGGPEDVIVEGLNGHLVDVDDVEKMAERVVEVLRLSEAEWSRMSEAAYATAREFTARDAALRFEAALEEAIREPAYARLRSSTL